MVSLPVKNYVYHIVVDGVVRYVGEGAKRRAWDHLNDAASIPVRLAAGQKVKATYVAKRLVGALNSGASVQIVIVKDGLTKDDAYRLEEIEISKFGLELLGKGTLWNRISGGRRGASEAMKRKWADPKYREMVTRRVKEAYESPELRKHLRTVARKKAADPEYLAARNARLALGHEDAARKKANASIKEALNVPECRERRSLAQLSRWANDDARQAYGEKIRESWENPDVRSRRSQSIRDAWARPETRLKRKELRAARKPPREV